MSPDLIINCHAIDDANFAGEVRRCALKAVPSEAPAKENQNIPAQRAEAQHELLVHEVADARAKQSERLAPLRCVRHPRAPAARENEAEQVAQRSRGQSQIAGPRTLTRRPAAPAPPASARRPSRRARRCRRPRSPRRPRRSHRHRTRRRRREASHEAAVPRAARAWVPTAARPRR